MVGGGGRAPGAPPGSAPETIAEAYMGIAYAKVAGLKNENSGNSEGFIKGVIRFWMNQNDGPDQVKVSVTASQSYIPKMGTEKTCILMLQEPHDID